MIIFNFCCFLKESFNTWFICKVLAIQRTTTRATHGFSLDERFWAPSLRTRRRRVLCNRSARIAGEAFKGYSKANHLFNGRDKWLLRRIIRDHNVIRSDLGYCILCSSNTSRYMLRTKQRSDCNICSVTICTIPRKEEDGLSCFQKWHKRNKLTERIYYSSSEKERKLSPSHSRDKLPTPAVCEYRAQNLAEGGK